MSLYHLTSVSAETPACLSVPLKDIEPSACGPVRVAPPGIGSRLGGVISKANSRSRSSAVVGRQGASERACPLVDAVLILSATAFFVFVAIKICLKLVSSGKQ